MSRSAQQSRMDAYVVREIAADPFATNNRFSREDKLGFALSDWLSKAGREMQFGLRITVKMQPMDGEDSRITHGLLSKTYWSGGISKKVLDAARVEIDRASHSYFNKGKVAQLHPKKGKFSKARQELLKRDGGDCWLCGKVMLGFDTTIEHLLAKSLGGGDDLANLRLTHAGCNRRLGNMSVEKKRALRDEIRGETT